MWFSALKDFFSRYLTVWRNVWAVRDQLDPPPRSEDERAFLPAHLELTETPLSAAPKVAARLIMLFTVLALVWSWFGHIDIVATASGKTSSGSRSKIIQPLETAVVKAVHVRDGQHVQANETLLELEAVGTDSDVAQSEQALQAAQLSKLRYESVLNALQTHTAPRMDWATAKTFHISETDFQAAQILAQNQYQAWAAQDNYNPSCVGIKQNCNQHERKSKNWFRWARLSSKKLPIIKNSKLKILFRNTLIWSRKVNLSAIKMIYAARAVKFNKFRLPSCKRSKIAL